MYQICIFLVIFCEKCTDIPTYLSEFTFNYRVFGELVVDKPDLTSQFPTGAISIVRKCS